MGRGKLGDDIKQEEGDMLWDEGLNTNERLWDEENEAQNHPRGLNSKPC